MMSAPLVRNNTDESRFESGSPDQLAKLDYKLDGDRLIAFHTEVPEALEGNGIGTALVEALFAYAAEQDLKVVPLCRFVAGWVKRHPERQAQTARL